MTKITKEEFVQWLNGPIAKTVFEALRAYREEVNRSLTNAELVMGSDFEKKAARMIGTRDGLDLLLNIEFEDIEEETKDGTERT